MTTLALSPPQHLLRRSDLALLLVAVVWGTSYGVAKGALAFYPVLGFLAVRFGLTFFLLLPALLRASRVQQRDAWRTGLPLGGLLLGRRPAQAIFVFAGISLLGAGLLSGWLAGEFGWGDGLMLAALWTTLRRC